ncbi:hypothetical protein L9G16_22820, partial [Shewanella sp. A25]|nr:hypothetical protein [Shewanella shenzhenensis]
YLRFFVEDDNKLEEVKKSYESGEMLTGELKKVLIDVLTPIVTEHQQRRAKVTEDLVDQFMSLRPLKFKSSPNQS